MDIISIFSALTLTYRFPLEYGQSLLHISFVRHLKMGTVDKHRNTFTLCFSRYVHYEVFHVS